MERGEQLEKDPKEDMHIGNTMVVGENAMRNGCFPVEEETTLPHGHTLMQLQFSLSGICLKTLSQSVILLFLLLPFMFVPLISPCLPTTKPVIKYLVCSSSLFCSSVVFYLLFKGVIYENSNL